MNSLTEVLEKATQTATCEILFRPDQVPLVRQGQKWQNWGSDRMRSQELRSWVLELLDEESQARLHQQRFFQTNVVVQKQSYHLSLSCGSAGYSVHLRWLPSQLLPSESWGFPAVYLEGFFLQGAFHLLTGPQEEARLICALSVLQELARQRPLNIHFFSQREDLMGLHDSAGINFFPLDSFSSWWKSRLGADIVFVDTDDVKFIRQALDLSLQGQSVFLSIPRALVSLALQSFAVQSERPQETQWILSKIFQSGIGVRTHVNAEGVLTPVYELMMGTELIKNALRLGDWNQLESTLATAGDRTGMRTLNQSLLQAVLKRKIEMKSAFEISPDPQDLDQLLKKVGI